MKKTPPTSSQKSIRRLAEEWPPEDTNFFHVMITGIESYLPPRSKHQSAREALECCTLARKFGLTEKGVHFLLAAESARKDFLLYDRAVKGELFTQKPPRGLDDLGNILFKILRQFGKKASSNEVFAELLRIAKTRSPNSIIQEVDEENTVYWRNGRGFEKTTSSRSIRNRLANLRKKNPH